jgi:hypothetical protein
MLLCRRDTGRLGTLAARASQAASATFRHRGRSVMIRFITITFAAALVGGCAAPTVSEVRAPDGRIMKNVKCNGDAQKCMNLASETCKDAGGTYQVIRSHSNAGGTAADIMPGPVTWYNMTFACGPSDGMLPRFDFQGPQFAPSQGTTYTSCSSSGRSVNCVSY